MPRNGSGTYTLPAGNPVTSGTLIEASWANNTMSDLASAITDSLARNGEGGMTAPLRFADGTVGAPGFSWTNETSTGIYRSGSGDMRVSLQGVDVGIWNSTGLTIPSAKALSVQGNATVGGTLDLQDSLSVTGASTFTTFSATGMSWDGSTFMTSSSTAFFPQDIQRNTTNDANGSYYALEKNRNGAAVQNNDILGNVVFRGYDGTNYLQAAAIWSRVNGTPGTNDMPGALVFGTTPDGGSGPTERMTLDASGVLAVPAGMTTATQTSGTNNTTVATTAFVNTAVNAAIQALHPVGSIYINATDSTNPATLLGFGTWTAFGAGRVPVGFDAGNALFDAAEETGGSYDAVVVSHSHTATSTVTDPGHTHTTNAQYIGAGGGLSGGGVGEKPATINSATTGITVSTTVSSTGSSGTNANVQPYITVYMWKRTA
jgi:hypothetical protein